MYKCSTIFLALGFLSLVKTNVDNWQHECPRQVCVCHTTLLTNLPIFSVMQQTKHHTKTKPNINEELQLHKNEVLEENDMKIPESLEDDDSLLTSAMCILGAGVDTLSLLSALPSKLEVLIILQSSDSDNVTLEANHFSSLQNLVALEIHGFHHDETNKSLGMLSLHHDVFKQVTSLKYLNLEHVHLIGQKEEDNKPAPIAVSNVMLTQDLTNSMPLIGLDNYDRYQIPGLLDHQLKFLEPSDLKILPYEMYLKGREYSSIFTFSGLTELKILRVFHCSVKHLSWEMFDGLHNLEKLSLEGNRLLFLPEFSFYGTPSLKYLCLAHNNLLSIKSTNLIGLLQLEQLDISYNNISHLSELSLPPFPKLKSADFHHNPIELIIPHTFDMMNVTEELYIGGHAAPLQIQLNTFKGLQSIVKLGMTNVKLKILEKDHLKGMPKLKELKIQGKINVIAFDAFLEVHKLEVLILHDCSIHQISIDTFYGLENLIYLDLSKNFLESIPSGTFDQLHSLKELNLRKNRLTNLPLGIFYNLRLQMIRLDQNPWHCTCRMWMDDWNQYVINNIKKRILYNPKCQFRFDKGSMCDLEPVYHYVYEKKATPRCTTPLKYNGWSVFHVLRKVLRCDTKRAHSKVKYNKPKYVVKTKNVQKVEEIGHLTNDFNNLTTVSTIASYPLDKVYHLSNYNKQNLEPSNELNALGMFSDTLNFKPEKIVGNKEILNENMTNELTITNQENIPHEVTSQTVSLGFKELFAPNTLKFPLKKQIKYKTSDVEKISQNREKLSDKPINNNILLDYKITKSDKVKALKESFKKKLYKTMQMEKL